MARINQWPRFANGEPFPCFTWGCAFREPAQELIDGSEGRISLVTVMAISQSLTLGGELAGNDEVASVLFGGMPGPGGEAALEFARTTSYLSQNGNGKSPEWGGVFDEPFETLRTRARQESLGLLVITNGTNGNGAEMASFGPTSPEVTVHSLVTVSNRICQRAGVELPTGMPTAQEAA